MEDHIGDYLALWAVGFILGETIKIDMAYTREHKVLRILVGCLNYTKIPHTFPMFIKDGPYELSLEVERERERKSTLLRMWL